MPVRNIVCAAAVVFLVLSAQVRATTITYSGSVEGTQVSDWRTSTTPKTMDFDGNNVYGSMGAMSETYSPAGQQSPSSTTLGWAFGGSGSSTFTVPGYVQVDDILTPSTNVTAGVCFEFSDGNSYFNFYLTGVGSDYAGKVVRVGVMQDVLDPSGWSGDSHKTLRLTQLTGGTGDSGLVSVRGAAAGNGVPEMYFFDIAGAGPGDEFKISAPNASGYQAGYLGPISWDIATVPEPSSMTLLAIAFLAYAWRKQR